MNDTTPVTKFTVHTLVSELVTDFVPSLLVVNVGVNESPTTAEAGRFEIETDVLAFATLTCCACPSTADQFADAATCATSVHVPVAMNDTTPVPAFTVHTFVSELVTDVAPSLLVVNVGVNESPTTGDVGVLLIATVGVAFVT